MYVAQWTKSTKFWSLDIYIKVGKYFFCTSLVSSKYLSRVWNLKIGHFLPGLYENINVGKGLKLYDPPCRETTVLAITHRRRVVMDYHRIFIVVHYDATHFKEITNNRAFTTFDLWSQIGGFVGIFLGYSCLQVI